MAALTKLSDQEKETVSLPEPVVQIRSFDAKKAPCPLCHRPSRRESRLVRRAHALGSLPANQPLELEIHYSYHICDHCHKRFANPAVGQLLPPNSQYTQAVIDTALDYVTEQNLPLREASWCMWRYHRVFVPWITIRNWVVAAGKKINLEKDYQPHVLDHFSGYLVIDEIYDGPFSILYATDPAQGHRITYRILEDNPTEDDVDQFCQDLRTLLDKRSLVVYGVTTDGSPLYTNTIPKNFPQARHQICVFHILKELIKLIIRALARYRRELKSQMGERCCRGRPKNSERLKIAKQKKQARYIKALFDCRSLWVKRRPTAKEKKVLKKLSRGYPLLRALRELMDTVYALLDKRCRTQTARRKLEKLRRRHLFKRFPELDAIRKKLEHPNLDRALEFLDDRLLESTSNAVERSNRRHRKMQKSVYRVRTAKTIDGRIKLDMMRDLSLIDRGKVTYSLHRDRLSNRQEIVKEHAALASQRRRKKVG